MKKKSLSPKNKHKENNDVAELNYTQEFLYLGHYIKYNLYLMCKSIIFSTLSPKFQTVDEAIEATNNVIKELDLDSKSKN